MFNSYYKSSEEEKKWKKFIVYYDNNNRINKRKILEMPFNHENIF